MTSLLAEPTARERAASPQQGRAYHRVLNTHTLVVCGCALLVQALLFFLVFNFSCSRVYTFQAFDDDRFYSASQAAAGRGQANSQHTSLSDRLKLIESQQQGSNQQVGCKSQAPCDCSSLTHAPTLTSLSAVIAEGQRLAKDIQRWKLAAAKLDLTTADGPSHSNSGGGVTLASVFKQLPQLAAYLDTSSNCGRIGVTQSQAATFSALTANTKDSADDEESVNGHPITTIVSPPQQYIMRPAEEVAEEVPELASLAAKHANPHRELMLTLANGVMICKNSTICWWNGGNILGSFLTILQRSNITNHLIGVMDQETNDYLAAYQANLTAAGSPFIINWFTPNVKVPEVQANTREANRVSSLKFTLLQTLMQLGYHTLITDMDLVYMDNPFNHLHRDADIESSSDGFNDWAYGAMQSIHDPSMGWGGGGLYLNTFTINVGCAYIRATHRAFHLVKSVAEHLAREPGWDQQVFNEHLLTLSHGDATNPYATLRIMDIRKFVNSKTFFKSYRHEYIPGKQATAATPVMVHFNYHPNKHERMLCIMDRYFYGKVDACDRFPAGSEK